MADLEYLTYHAYEGGKLTLEYVTSELYSEAGDIIPHNIGELILRANNRAEWMVANSQDNMFLGKVPSHI